MQVIADGADHDFPGIESHPDTQLEAVGAAHRLRVLVHGGLHGQGGVAGAQGVVFVGQRRPEEGHDTVAQHLVHRTLEAVHGVHHAMQGGVEELLGGFWIEILDQLGRVFDVGEQHRDLLALALQSAARGQDLLGKIRWGVGQRGACGLVLGRRCGAGHSLPNEHLALLVGGQLLGMDEFVLQGLNGLVIQLELQFQRPIGHTSATLEEGDNLIQHDVKVHHRPSTCASAASACGSQKLISMTQ